MTQQAKLILFLLVFLVTQRAYTFIWNQPLPKDFQPKLILQNHSDHQMSIWLQHRKQDLINEDLFIINTRAEIKLEFSEWNPESLAYSIKSFDKQLQVLLEFQDQKRIQLSTTPAKDWEWSSSNSQAKKIHVLNLFSEPQLLDFTNGDNQRLQVKTKNYYDTITFEIPPSHSFKISGPGRFKVLVETDLGLQEAQAVFPDLSARDIPTIGNFFLISTDSLQESFLIHLTDPEQINQARQALSSKTQKILIADIGPNFSLWNRPFAGPQSPAWSWSVQKVIGFSDVASLSCDGNSNLVEERLLSWLSFGRICFWKSHLIKELSRKEVLSGQLNSRQDLQSIPLPRLLPLAHEFPRL